MHFQTESKSFLMSNQIHVSTACLTSLRHAELSSCSPSCLPGSIHPGGLSLNDGEPFLVSCLSQGFAFSKLLPRPTVLHLICPTLRAQKHLTQNTSLQRQQHIMVTFRRLIPALHIHNKQLKPAWTLRKSCVPNQNTPHLPLFQTALVSL